MTTPEQNAQQQANPQQQKQQSIFESKSLFCADVRKIITRPLLTERLLKMVGGDESKLAKYMTSFFAVLMADDGGSEGNKKYFWQCNIQSIVGCFMESVNMGLPFDSRQLVCMIIYKKDDGYEAELDISYKGFVNALNKKYKDAFVECKLVFEKDKFKSKIVDRTAHYEYEPADAFAVIDKDFKGIKGGYCYFSYQDTDGQKTSRLVFLSREQIMNNRSRARTKFVWDSDPKAMGEKTCIREGARLPFAAIDMEVDIEAVDNKHYQLEKPDAHSRLTALIEAQDADLNPKPEEGKPDDKPETPDVSVGNTPNADAGKTGDAKPADTQAATPTQDAAAATHAGDKAVVQKDEKQGQATVADKQGNDAPVSIQNQPVGNQGNGEVLAPAKTETKPAITITAAVDTTYEEMPLNPTATSPASSEGAAPATPTAWDGKTLYMGNGKHITKDSFTSSQQAAVYLKKVINQRTKKETREEIWAGNALLMNALERDGNTAIIEDLTKLIEQGE